MSDLAFHVRQFVPDCTDGAEMGARQKLLIARDYAITLITTRRELVSMDHAIQARTVADHFVFADVPIHSLEVAVRYCRALEQCAFIADILELEWEALA